MKSLESVLRKPKEALQQDIKANRKGEKRPEGATTERLGPWTQEADTLSRFKVHVCGGVLS